MAIALLSLLLGAALPVLGSAVDHNSAGCSGWRSSGAGGGSGGGCDSGDDGRDEVVGLLQAKISKHQHSQRGMCQVGDHVPCPDGGNCAGEQCCPGAPGQLNYPCPSAPIGWGLGYCQSVTKKVDCVSQAKGREYVHSQRGTCQVGDPVSCPDGGSCAGEQCCNGAPGQPNYPCPSAPTGWGPGHCQSGTKKLDCVSGGGPTPSPAPPAPPAPAPSPPNADYHPHFDTSADYLNIAGRAKGVRGNPGHVSDNFYLVVGDQGGCGGCGDCCAMQKQVAAKMKEYVDARKAANPNSELLFVGAVGDNFYWTGAGGGSFSRTWKNVYDSTITSVPWFAVLGNHDYGNSDPGIACPDVSPRFTCDSSNMHTSACGGPKPYSTQPQGYDSNALNADKGGVDGNLRSNFHQPDYTYYYTIPDLDLEVIAMDWNAYDIGGFGGNGFGPSGGASALAAHCGGVGQLTTSVEKIKKASTELLNGRSRAAESKNVAILGHYPDGFQANQNFRQMYLDGLPGDKRDAGKVFNFFGHTHAQQCRGKDSSGECVNFLTGGSGGCCSTGDVPAGFVAVSFTSDGTQTVECFLEGGCTLRSYGLSHPWELSGNASRHGQTVCRHTDDDQNCANYRGPGS